MIDKRTIFEIHRLKNLSLSVRHIAKRLNLSRKTVKKYIEEPMASYTRNVPKPSKLTPYHDVIDQALARSPRINRREKGSNLPLAHLKPRITDYF